MNSQEDPWAEYVDDSDDDEEIASLDLTTRTMKTVDHVTKPQGTIGRDNSLVAVRRRAMTGTLDVHDATTLTQMLVDIEKICRETYVATPAGRAVLTRDIEKILQAEN